MAAITSINAKQVGPFVATGTTLTSDDTITVNSGVKQLLVLTNTTGGTLTATVDGSLSTSVTVAGLGSVDVSAGKAIAVPAGESRAVVLSTIKEYCKGVVHLLGGTGLKAQLFDL